MIALLPAPTQLDSELADLGLEIDSTVEYKRKAPYSRYLRYRVWKDSDILGTFHRQGTRWIASPVSGKSRRFKTAQEAQNWIWRNRPQPAPVVHLHDQLPF